MKLIDFERKGNLIRLYLGKKEFYWGWTNSKYKDFNGKTPDWLTPSDIYYGDDWNDAPYEHNAGRVYAEFVKDTFDLCVDFDDLVLEPCDGEFSSRYTKEDMVKRKVPCFIIVPKNIRGDSCIETFSYWLGVDGIKKYYFGDEINKNSL